MKRITVLFFLLTLASPATAKVYITVDGIVDPADHRIVLGPSQVVTIGLFGDGSTLPPWDAFLVVQGPGAIYTGDVNMLYPGSLSYCKGYAEVCLDTELCASIRERFPSLSDLCKIGFADADGPPLEGFLLDGILFHCQGDGSIILTLCSPDFTIIYDEQAIVGSATGGMCPCPWCYLASPALLSHWKLDEEEGPVVYDSADYHNGLAFGAQWCQGVLLGALSFDGTDDYVQVGDD